MAGNFATGQSEFNLAKDVPAAVKLFRVIRPSVPQPAPPPVPPPLITYALDANPPSFSIDDDASSRGLELSLSVQNDPGVQAVVEMQP